MALALAAGAHGAAAQNLLLGGDFDSSTDLTAYWGNLSAATLWSPDDFEGSFASGSLRIVNEAAANTGIGAISGCVPVTPSASYEARAWYLIPLLQTPTGHARLLVQWRESCPLGAFTGDDQVLSANVLADWTLIEGTVVPPPDATGARVWLTALKSTGDVGDSFIVHFDAVFLPEPGPAVAPASALLALLALVRRRRPARRSA